MQHYRGIPHRLEFFYETERFKFYNDSAATIPEAAAAAVNAFEKPVILITGGTDKKLDFTSLAPELKKAKALFLLAGTGTDKLTPLLRAQHTPFFGPFDNLSVLLQALKHEISSAEQETVVFSPGATSFGMFKNEFDRGNCFKEAVRSCWPQGKALAN